MSPRRRRRCHRLTWGRCRLPSRSRPRPFRLQEREHRQTSEPGSSPGSSTASFSGSSTGSSAPSFSDRWGRRIRQSVCDRVWRIQRKVVHLHPDRRGHLHRLFRIDGIEPGSNRWQDGHEPQDRGPGRGKPHDGAGGQTQCLVRVNIVPVVGWLLSLLAVIYIAVTINNSPARVGWHDTFAGGTRVVKTK